MKYVKRQRTSKGLIRLFVITAIVAVLYVGSLFLFANFAKDSGDADISTVPNLFNYYLQGVKDLFLFNYANNSNVAYFALSVFLYALIACWLIFLIGGIVVAKKKRRKIMWWGIVLTFVNLLLYALYAAGSKKYWHIVNGHSPYEGKQELAFMAILIIMLGSLHIVLSLVSYFWSIFESFINPRVPEDELNKQEELKEANQEDEDAWIRKIVRDEIENNQPFGIYVVNEQFEVSGLEPKVIYKEAPAPAPQPEPEPEPQPEPEPEPLPEPEPVIVMEEPKEEEIIDIPLREEEPEQEEVVMDNPEEGDPLDNLNKKPRDPFMARIVKADLDIKANYNELKNEILSYGVKSRVSRDGDIFRLHKKRYVKIYLVGKTLKVYLALSPEDYKDSTFPVEDVGHKPNYADLPLLFKVRSGLSVRRCKELIKAVMEKDGLNKKEIDDVNWVNELRTQHAEKARESK